MLSVSENGISGLMTHLAFKSTIYLSQNEIIHPYLFVTNDTQYCVFLQKKKKERKTYTICVYAFPMMLVCFTN